jgi:hypothetical protein
MDDYIAAARQFERLGRLETRPEAKLLIMEQAETCYRLAHKRAREITPMQPLGAPVQ